MMQQVTDAPTIDFIPTDEATPDEIEAILEAEVSPPMIIGPDGEEMPAAELALGIEKFKKYGNKHYRLIWVNGNKSWLAQEDVTEFRRKGDCVSAGEEMAKKVGAKRFSEVTR